MANYNGRRMPNFSQYLDDLNAIPSPYDQAQQQQQQQTTFNDEDLALFTNTEFFEFDKFTDFNGLPSFSAEDDKTHEAVSDQSAQNVDLKFLDFLNAEGLNGITDFQPDLTGSNVQVPMHNAHFPAVPSVPSGPVAANQAPLQPAPIHTAPKVAQTPSSVSMSPSTPVTGTKRKNSAHSSQESAEEASRQMAEEDKRRRNTAASARFRVKKKQREAALEQTVKETTDKNDILEARVSQLELENHWLRGLIMEKNGADEQSEQDISNMFKKFLASQKADESSISDLKRGVGTTV
ncbi:transcriptional regulator family: bZIP [Penicillium psychrosexuale]|uniref:transcriptional regulator family: bZIP n=1 Tax=Penicillium psychrosexuale TaxID=1002107 RepID=UPI0025450B57|nr:transcriptional regulator family: bZIP [Penicillium psychrosexuale]KAJ5790447.1 transcriptional regulator family: bZIP [Penicillium psychrosexuale]